MTTPRMALPTSTFHRLHVTIGQLSDVSALVAETNQFNDPPPEGAVFAAFDDFSTLAFGCGVVPNEFVDQAEVFVGGTVSGTVCVPIPAEDLADPTTSVSLGFSDRIYFAPDGESPEAASVPPVEADMVITERNGARESPYAYGSPEAVEFESYGDADGSIWITTTSEPRDLTAEVLAENQFNDPPEEGTTFVAVDVEMTLDSADVEPLSPLSNFSWGMTANTRVTLHFAEDTRAYFG